MRFFSRSAAFAWCALVFPALPVAVTHAQTSAAATSSPTPAVTSLAGFWRCELPGGTFLVALRNIQSVSTSEYVVDGAARVTEMTVGTSSSVEARFYYLEPMTATTTSSDALTHLQQLQKRVQDTAAERAGTDKVWEKVVKNYPTTTHAHTVEYRLTSKENLQQLYTGLEQAWITGKGISVKTE